ncbi:MAG: Na+/H+ antiporter NhaC family protein [Corynebacterium casei]|uniref:Na+/H+ antiporter NhaC family protein n=1 Tax=Corynebacterium casei TaxID=160386 RepID=UPI003F8F108A
MVESFPLLTILPPLVAIIMVIATKRVLLSLLSGSLLSILLITNFHPLESLKLLFSSVVELFWVEGALNWYNILILTFLLELGAITALVLMSGGTAAFSNWARKRVKSRRDSQILTAILGMAIFIDDYFNALAVGQISRPISDQQKVSRAKLAYLVDSSSAPTVVLVPLSSWGASIIGIMAPIIAASALTMSEMEVFLRSAVLNFYAVAAIILLWIVVLWQLDFGAMRKEEQRAALGEGVMAEGDDAPGQITDDLPTHHNGTISALVVPFEVLVVGVVGGMYISGALAAGSWSMLDAMANADVALTLNIGGVAGLLVALAYCVSYTRKNPKFDSRVIASGTLDGAKSMLPAIYILLLAWMLGSLIGQLGTGAYFANIVTSLSVPPVWLIPILFLVAGGMAFATGTSWGAFGILLPLAGEIINAAAPDGTLLIPAFGAVLAGSVWGDHSSPISDTTILSSTGAGCAVATHVNTQLPYAFVGAIAALVGYVLYAATTSAIIGFVSMLVALIVIAVVLKSMNKTTVAEVAAEA